MSYQNTTFFGNGGTFKIRYCTQGKYKNKKDAFLSMVFISSMAGKIH